MKVAFFNFFPFTMWTPGGGEIQMQKIRQFLLKIGVEVEMFDPNYPKFYRLFHLFTSTYQVADLAVAIRNMGTKLVVNSNVNTNKPWWWGAAWSLVDRFLPLPTLYTYRKRIYDAAHLIIPNSIRERDHIAKAFDVPLEKFRVIRNGVDPDFQNADPEIFQEEYGVKDFILRVQSVSPGKNQLRLIQAWKRMGKPLPLVLIGPPVWAYPDYVSAVRRAVEEEGVLWIEYIPHDDPLLASAYAACRVHVMASLGESTGLVSLEAGLAGAKLVAVDHPIVREYLGDNAVYCNAKSVYSIADAIQEALEAPPPNRNWFKQYTWDRIVPEYMRAYQEVLEECQDEPKQALASSTRG